MLKAWRFTKTFFKEIGDDDLSGGAAELAYRFFLALFPFFIFLASLGGFVASSLSVQDPTQKVMDWLGETVPPEANTLLREQLSNVVENQNPALLSLGIIGAIWAASAGIGAVAKNMNRAYEVKETRPVWRRYVLNVGLTLTAGASLVAALVILLAGQVAGMDIASRLGFEGQAAVALNLGRLLIVVLLILTATSVLYWAAPNVDIEFKWITPGAVVFTLGWLVASYLFGLYVSHLGSYNATYGTLGGFVILMAWFYITAFILLLGAELNAVVAQLEVPDELPQTPAQGRTAETIPSAKGTRNAQQAEEPKTSTGPRPGLLALVSVLELVALAVLALIRGGRKASSQR